MSKSRLNGVDRTQQLHDPVARTLQIPRPDGKREWISPAAFLALQPDAAKARLGLTDADHAAWQDRASQLLAQTRQQPQSRHRRR